MGWWAKEQEGDAYQPITLDTHGAGTFSKHGCLLSSVVFISSNVLLFDTIVIILCKKRKKERNITFEEGIQQLEGDWKMMLAEENLLLKLGGCRCSWLPAMLLLLQCFLPDALRQGTEMVQFFYSLCQRSGS